jgi:hypothetical protein
MALPKYRETKKIIEEMLNERITNVSRSKMVPFNDSPSIVQHEGKTLIHNTLDNSSRQKTMSYQKSQFEYVFKYEDVPNMQPEDVLKIVDEKAEAMGEEMAKYHFKVLDETVKEAGNVVDAKGEKPNIDMFLGVLEKISITFDKDGKPNMPTMIISPKQANDWKAVMEQSKTPEIDEKFKEIMKKKKEEYDAEQASRKLVD